MLPRVAVALFALVLRCFRRLRPRTRPSASCASSAMLMCQRNGDLLVTETIQVWAEGREIRRGILRDFPTTLSPRRRLARRGRLRRAVA